MFEKHSIFRRPLPTEPRQAVDIPCRLRYAEAGCPARLRDYSGGGLRLELSEDVPQSDLHGTFAVEIADMGCVAVELKWRKGRMLGCSFRSKFESRQILSRICRHKGLHLF
ncbi:PilZ domain-containing protein [Aliiruegeria sabulilitoris]|uniref:PilZ domain-containing protein n=1 Tax=Aliiruegeria sabulilitoris TaxID=1510458 RepID=UPI00083167D0|nr:PilZ domain-containing protein [Aliiruegeria sabulilitoris]NDR59312.1 PilZ domain-containing protein [Pseudoruegeria sp. M32A2M]